MDEEDNLLQKHIRDLSEAYMVYLEALVRSTNDEITKSQLERAIDSAELSQSIALQAVK